jgi:hypothetical protein
MSRRSRLLRLRVAALVGAVLSLSPASAQVLLKPNGQMAAPLLTRAVAADVTVDGQFATTRLQLTFQNESPDRIEADFIYTLPPDTVVTYFAYWYEKEKVVARIVEKERAAAIYQHITTRMRDPALVELIGKNKFRARIFPVMPNSDLKVEMTLVQALPSDETGVTYEFPFPMENGAALDSARVRVRMKRDAAIEKVTTNYGLPVVEESEGYRLELSGTNFRPSKSLRVHLDRRPQPLHAALHAARSGGRDGFFALALTPAQSLTAPTVSIEGVPTYDRVPSALPAVAAHRALLLCGRYRGGGRATVILTGRTPQGPVTYRQPVWFSTASEPNHMATKLWAARKIDQYGKLAANRRSVIALSQRFTLPSPFTSWLAVPRAEIERYREEKIDAELAVIASHLACEIIEGRRSGPAARQLRARLKRECRAVRRDPREVLSSHLYSRLYDLSRKLMEEKYGAKPDQARMRSLRRQVSALERETGSSAEQDLYWVKWWLVEPKIDAVRAELLAERRKAQPDPAKVRRLEQRFTALNRQIHPRRYALARTARLALRTDAEKLDQLLSAAPTQADAARLAALQQRRAEMRKREGELRARMGDPLIRIDAPADAEQVVALMPGGEIKRLQFNPQSRQWEARFDIPTYASEGQYEITVVIVHRDGRRQLLTLRYHLDVTPPAGRGSAAIVPGADPTLRLELVASEDTARVMALLPWGEQVALRPAGRPRHFFGSVPVPPAHRGRADRITFILTDRAHNRTMVTVDMEDR